MGTVTEKLRLLDSTISEILATSGSPDLSLGVLQQGKVVHAAHFGNKDISYSSPPNNDTTYRIASLTKAITACAIGVLVGEGNLS
jgi:CubicO group peptidase (beta-lactamase class C family)